MDSKVFLEQLGNYQLITIISGRLRRREKPRENRRPDVKDER
jgi:hypothetical protein